MNKKDKKELLGKLVVLKDSGDPEHGHCEADKALLDFINDEEITNAFDEIEKWYA